MSGIALSRLQTERKNWRNDSIPGFYAKPLKNSDNSTNLFKWEVGIPGKPNTDWESGVYIVHVTFPASYPQNAPKCEFVPPLCKFESK